MDSVTLAARNVDHDSQAFGDEELPSTNAQRMDDDAAITPEKCLTRARYAVGADGNMTFGACALGLSDCRTTSGSNSSGCVA